MNRRQSGFTMIELMVSLAVGLVLSLAVFATMAVSEGRRRATTAVNDIGQSGSYALYAIDKWVRSAGTGFTQAASYAYGCQLLAARGGSAVLPRATALPAPFASLPTTFRLAPVLIVPGATTPGVSGQASDVLLVMSAATGRAAQPVVFTSPPDAGTLHVTNSFNFAANDMVLVTDQQLAATGVRPCLIDQVASSLGTTGTDEKIPLGGTWHSGGVGGVDETSYTGGGVALHVGNVANDELPAFLAIGVGDHDTLYSADLLQPEATSLLPVAAGVFELHALYGIDADGYGKVTQWVSPAAGGDYTLSALTDGTAVAAARIRTIKAVRVGLILRTPLPEKTAVTATADTPTLFADLGDTLTFTRAWQSDDERRYRYRVFEQTIPVRNPILLDR